MAYSSFLVEQGDGGIVCIDLTSFLRFPFLEKHQHSAKEVGSSVVLVILAWIASREVSSSLPRCSNSMSGISGLLSWR